MEHKSMNRFKRMGSLFLLELSHPLVLSETVEQLKVTDVGMAGDTGFLSGFLDAFFFSDFQCGFYCYF